jgi:hypothetical protein
MPEQAPYPHGKTRFFKHLAHRRVARALAWLDSAARRHPDVPPLMPLPHEQYARLYTVCALRNTASARFNTATRSDAAASQAVKPADIRRSHYYHTHPARPHIIHLRKCSSAQ